MPSPVCPTQAGFDKDGASEETSVESHHVGLRCSSKRTCKRASGTLLAILHMRSLNKWEFYKYLFAQVLSLLPAGFVSNINKKTIVSTV